MSRRYLALAIALAALSAIAEAGTGRRPAGGKNGDDVHPVYRHRSQPGSRSSQLIDLARLGSITVEPGERVSAVVPPAVRVVLQGKNGAPPTLVSDHGPGIVDLAPGKYVVAGRSPLGGYWSLRLTVETSGQGDGMRDPFRGVP